MNDSNFFLQNQDEEIFSPLDLDIVRAQLAQLCATDGSYIVIQNKLRVGEFLQCVASDRDRYIIETKRHNYIYQLRKAMTIQDTIDLVELFREDNLKIGFAWKRIIL